jgi:hypothetical protein
MHFCSFSGCTSPSLVSDRTAFGKAQKAGAVRHGVFEAHRVGGVNGPAAAGIARAHG